MSNSEYGLNYPKAVSFDIWNTLIKPNMQFKTGRNEYFASFFQTTAAQMEQLIHLVDERLDVYSERTGVDYGFEDRITALAKELLGSEAIIDSELIERLYADIESLFLNNLPIPLEGDIMINTLDRLQADGLALYIVSNTGFIRGETMRKALLHLGLGDFFEGFVFSNEVGYAKPDRRIFEHLMQLAGTPKIVHVGDNYNTDYQGSTQADMTGLLLSPQKKSVKKAYTVYSLSEVPSVLHLGV